MKQRMPRYLPTLLLTLSVTLSQGPGLDELPGRGFAGQIVFLTANSPTPVEVEGDVTIFLFDDQGTPEERSKPLHMFRFDAGSWQTYLTPTAWGPTYQLFIPYVRKGFHRASCSLAVQIEPPDSRRVTSAMANIVLPGSESLSDGTSTRYSTQHSRLPAGRVETVEPGGASQVLRASAESPLRSLPTGPRATGGETPKFEIFSIPYDFRQANAQ